jgi:hypothetical protein
MSKIENGFKCFTKLNESYRLIRVYFLIIYLSRRISSKVEEI